MIREYKAVPVEFKVDKRQRTFEGYASTFGNEDLVGDIIERGAFKKTIAERGPMGKNQIKILWNHDSNLGIGMPAKMYEDETGLYVVGQLSDIPENHSRLTLMEDGVYDAMSIGFSIPENKSWWEEDMWTRHIEEVKLYEFSPVAFPANELARITNVSKNVEAGLLLKSFGKETLLEKAEELKAFDPRMLDEAILRLREAKTLLEGSDEERRVALRNGRREVPQGEPPTGKSVDTPEPGEGRAAEPQEPEEEKGVDPELLEELQSFALELGLANELGR